MNSIIEQKLKELWQESLDQNALAVHVVAHLLLANYQSGSQGDFAKWCCRYVSGVRMNATIDGGQEVLPGEFSGDFETKEWIC